MSSNNSPDINRKYNYVYKITNLINKKIYIGVHRTDNMDDGYMGSGTLIKRAIQKYGIENFKKDIISFHLTYADALRNEKQIVTEDFLKKGNTYNLKTGGYGNTKWSKKGRELLSESAKQNWKSSDYREKMKTLVYANEDRNTKISKGVKEWIKNNPEEHKERMWKINKNPIKIKKTAEFHQGKKRSDETKKLISNKLKENFKDEETKKRLSGRGCKYAHNTKTGQIKRFNKEDKLPPGWLWGTPKQTTQTKQKRSNSLKGSYFAHNKTTLEIKRFKQSKLLPSGWERGYPKNERT